MATKPNTVIPVQVQEVLAAPLSPEQEARITSDNAASDATLAANATVEASLGFDTQAGINSAVLQLRGLRDASRAAGDDETAERVQRALEQLAPTA